MRVLEELESLVEKNDRPVKDVLVGVHWTLVESLNCGLASTQKEPPPHYNKTIADAGKLDEKSLLELAALVRSNNWLEASVGLAAVNSAIEIDEGRCSNENVYECIANASINKNVGIIGHFPFVERLKEKAKNLWVFELQPWPGDLGVEKMAALLPECDVVGITATTLINHTFGQVIDLCQNKSLKILLGPSTPMTPLLFDYNIDILAGAKVINDMDTKRMIKQGANFRQLKSVKLLTMKA